MTETALAMLQGPVCGNEKHKVNGGDLAAAVAKYVASFPQDEALVGQSVNLTRRPPRLPTP